MKTPAQFRSLIVALLFPSLTLLSNAQGIPGEVDLSFDPGSGIDGPIKAVAVRPDGKIIVGGGFSTLNGLARRHVGRLNSDGSGDPGFVVGAAVDEWGNSLWGTVSALALQPDGKVIVGHGYGVERLNSDGSLDTSFAADVGAGWEDDSVTALAVQPDGKVLIGGAFSEVNGTSRRGLARLNANGSIDRSFYSGAVLCCAHSLALQADGKVLVLGVFSVGGSNQTTLVRLNGDGSVDATFLVDEAISSASRMALLPDGRILVAGDITVGGFGIVRLNAEGSSDSGFTPRLLDFETHPSVTAMVVQPNGKILFSGNFATVDGMMRNQIARLHADGSLDEDFQSEMAPGGEVLTVVLQLDGRMLVAGSITTGSEPRRKPIARLDDDGSLDGSFQVGEAVDGRVTSLVVQPDGRILLGGSFTSVAGILRPGIARLQADGSLDRTFDPAVSAITTASHIHSIVLQRDGKVLVTGIFAIRVGDVFHHPTIARLHADGSLDNSFQPDLTTFVPTDSCPLGYWYCERSVRAERALVQADGGLIVSGSGVMIAYGDEALEYFVTPFVARFHEDGSLDSSFEFELGTTGSSIGQMLLQPDGKLLVSGGFTVEGAHRGMVRLHTNGSLDVSFKPDIPIDGRYLDAMALQSDGAVVIGGLAQWIFRDTALHLDAMARLYADGSLDAIFDPPTGEHDALQAIALQPDGKLLVAGRLYSIDGSSAPTVARLNSDGSSDDSFHRVAASGHIMALAFRPDGKALIGGDFSTLDAMVRPHVARLLGDSPMPQLNIVRLNGSVVLSWPATAWNVRLQEAAALSPPAAWSPVSQVPVTAGGLLSVQVPTHAPRKFFRLSLVPNSP